MTKDQRHSIEALRNQLATRSELAVATAEQAVDLFREPGPAADEVDDWVTACEMASQLAQEIETDALVRKLEEIEELGPRGLQVLTLAALAELGYRDATPHCPTCACCGS